MTYEAAIALIGLPVERTNPAAREYIVRDVTNERNDRHNVHLSGGQIIPLEHFEKMFRKIENVNNSR